MARGGGFVKLSTMASACSGHCRGAEYEHPFLRAAPLESRASLIRNPARDYAIGADITCVYSAANRPLKAINKLPHLPRAKPERDRERLCGATGCGCLCAAKRPLTHGSRGPAFASGRAASISRPVNQSNANMGLRRQSRSRLSNSLVASRTDCVIEQPRQSEEAISKPT